MFEELVSKLSKWELGLANEEAQNVQQAIAAIEQLEARVKELEELMVNALDSPEDCVNEGDIILAARSGTKS